MGFAANHAEMGKWNEEEEDASTSKPSPFPSFLNARVLLWECV